MWPADIDSATPPLISAFSERPVPADAIVFGELSLSGEVRQVAHDGLRLREAAKLGFSRGWGPTGMKAVGGISVTGFGRLGELVDLMLGRD
jgi:DNA repair protein RadA/Sms